MAGTHNSEGNKHHGDAQNPAQPILAAGIRTFTFHDSGAPVLQGIELAFLPGTFTAVLGPSGSGKSTLGRLLAGWLPPGGGGTLHGFLELAGTRLQFGGADLAPGPRINPAAWGRQAGFVPQDPASVLSTVKATVAEELAFGLENAAVGRAAMTAAVEQTAALVGLTELLDHNPVQLSGGQLRRLAIGCAVIAGPRILIMDEPFASLDSAGSARLANLVRELVKRGTAVVIFSQVVDAPLLEAGTWLVLAEGSARAVGTPAELLARPRLLPAGIRYPADASGPGQDKAATTAAQKPRTQPLRQATPTAPALELRKVSFCYSAGDRMSRRWIRRRGAAHGPQGPPPPEVLKGISLAVRPGEIVAVTGPNGAGKSTLLRHLNGLLRPTSGQILVGGAEIAGTPPGVVAQRVGLLFQQPRDQLFERTALREVHFGLDRLYSSTEATERAGTALETVGLAGSAHAHPAELPASSQRLLALATVLARNPSVLALDEPTVALDGNGLARLDGAVGAAAEEGAAVVLVTHDLTYARRMAHRVVTLDGGQLLP
ncbi:ABC transporter ATP-binding protein [Pseudarthrobacter sp. NamE5]|uniref:ABC transporter ATP-binding protein n=1 Tax=Pseudarthrobacter sp. NamE5 TaxID=2576839 RepID=UPI00110C0677|nr:ATP-binding cassette domain-containing protein [Pseudarthrobacter sp. NamE5]TLM83790.1 ATP-binding cassette domain-containing protein [Pseudarthrobacter sp. NamE5]